MEIYKQKQTSEIKGEVFKPLVENNQYLISNLGRVKSKQQIVNHNYGGKAIKKERVLTQTDNGSGYLSVGLTFNGKIKNYRVSRLVAITWINNSENKPQVNHINGIKYDNRVINLEWNTSGENIRHAWNNGLAKKQSSYLYIENRLKNINQYLIYKPRVKTPLGYGAIIIDQNNYRIEYDNGKYENLVKSVRFWKDDFKLVLHNLSDLSDLSEISEDGINEHSINMLIEKKYQIDYGIFSHYKGFLNIELDGDPSINYDQNKSIDINIILEIYNELLKGHYDIFGLIKEGLAIDINTL